MSEADYHAPGLKKMQRAGDGTAGDAASLVGSPRFSLVFAQDQIKAWVWTRGPAGFPSQPDVLEGEDAVVRIEALGINLPLAEVYARVRMD